MTFLRNSYKRKWCGDCNEKIFISQRFERLLAALLPHPIYAWVYFICCIYAVHTLVVQNNENLFEMQHTA